MCETIQNVFHKRYGLFGYYKCFVCFLENVGYFLKLTHVDDSYYQSTFDIKWERFVDDIFFKTQDYDCLVEFSKIYYYDSFYYGLLDYFVKDILFITEFGEFVFKSDIPNVINHGIIIR